MSEKLGCVPEPLCCWIRQTQRDQGKHLGSTTDEPEELKQLRRENRELKRSYRLVGGYTVRIATLSGRKCVYRLSVPQLS